MSQSQGAENTDWSFSDYPTIEQAEAHADKHLTSTRTHCQQVGEVMRSFAKKLELSEDEQKRRYMT